VPSELSSGVELMLVGMGTVFVFLTLLVFATRVMSSAVQRFFPTLELEKSVAAASAGGIPEEKIAAISIALAQHLDKQRQSPRESIRSMKSGSTK